MLPGQSAAMLHRICITKCVMWCTLLGGYVVKGEHMLVDAIGGSKRLTRAAGRDVI